jgi:uncharacterized protein YbjT (DUF2867 family)
MKKIMVLGATGMLGVPVTHRLHDDGFKVRVLTRDEEKARGMFHHEVEVFPGEVSDLKSLEQGLDGCFGVHISVGGALDQLSAENVSALAPKLGVDRITYISGATAFEQNRWFPMTAQKLNAEAAILDCGLPYTFFCPTWPMEQLPRLAMGGKPLIIGDRPIPYHWFAAEDLARMVSSVFQREEALNHKLFIHGPQALTMVEAMETYCQAFHPDVREVTLMPIEDARSMAKSTGNEELGSFAEMMAYFDKVGEMGDPSEANELLGAPSAKLDSWILRRARSAI